MRIQLLPDDIKAACCLHILPRSRFISAIGLVLLCAFYALAVAALTKIVSGTSDWDDWVTVLVAACPPIWYFILMPASIRKMYTQLKALQAPTEMIVTQDGIAATSANGVGVIPWNHVHKWRESKHVFLVYMSDEAYHIVPKRCIDREHEEILKTALLAYVGPAKGRVKPRPLRDPV